MTKIRKIVWVITLAIYPIGFWLVWYGPSFLVGLAAYGVIASAVLHYVSFLMSIEKKEA